MKFVGPGILLTPGLLPSNFQYYYKRLQTWLCHHTLLESHPASRKNMLKVGMWKSTEVVTFFLLKLLTDITRTRENIIVFMHQEAQFGSWNISQIAPCQLSVYCLIPVHPSLLCLGNTIKSTFLATSTIHLLLPSSSTIHLLHFTHYYLLPFQACFSPHPGPFSPTQACSCSPYSPYYNTPIDYPLGIPCTCHG